MNSNTQTDIYTKEQFEKEYASKDWKSYKQILALCILNGNPGKILDIGAGLGFFVECCERFGLKCVGIEGSKCAIETARKRSNIDIREHKLENKLPFKDSSFSIVVCNQIIEHLPNKTAKLVLKECYRVLDKDGCIIINSPCSYDKKQNHKLHINLYTPTELKQELERAGFIKVRSVDAPRNFFGDSEYGMSIMWGLFKIFKFDFISSTANCIGKK